jgi:hypothetical protein
MRLGHPEQARAFFQAAGSLAPYLFEPHHNYAKLAEEVKYYYGVFLDVLWLKHCFKGKYWLLSKFMFPVHVTAFPYCND